MLGFYDENQDPVSGPLHAYIDAISGGVYELTLWVRNDDSDFVYTDITVKYIVDDDEDWSEDMATVAGDGYHVKMWHTIRPTELAWASLPPATSIDLDDIGTVATLTPDTNTYLPVYIRVYSPGRMPTQIFRDHKINIVARPLAV